MGNFHCIPESCARVVWREYLPPKVRYRQNENQEWIYVSGNAANVQPLLGNCPTGYVVAGERYHDYYNKWTDETTRVKNFWWSKRGSAPFLGPVNSVDFNITIKSGNEYRTVIVDCANGLIEYGINLISQVNYEANNFPASLSGYNLQRVQNNEEIFWLKTYRLDGQTDDCGCKFTVYDNESIVFEKIFDTCPEYEILPCTLSDEYKEIKIEKLSYLEGIEVLNYAKDILAATNFFKAEIPPHCLNIYNTYLQPNLIPLEDVQYLDSKFIAQICSSPNCPPPEYQVPCNCNECESCPDGTCAVECDGHICCYNDYGVSVKQIDISNYCG